MLVARSSADRSLVREAHPSGGWVTTFIGMHHRQLPIGEAPPDASAPVAFLVEQGSGYIVRPHFHAVNQFQVFIAGSGRFGRQGFVSPAVHYAAAHTPYGPIVAGPEGFAYLTLRDGFDPGPRYMPESRQFLRSQRGGAPRLPATIAPVRRGDSCCAVFDLQPNGPGAWSLMVSGHARLDVPDSNVGSGQFWVVLDGSLEIDNKTFPVRSCFHRAGGLPPPIARAGAAGLWLLVLQYPRKTVP